MVKKNRAHPKATNPFEGIDNAVPLFALLGKNPSVGARLLTDLANAESPLAVERAGFGPDRLRQAALAVLSVSDTEEAARLAAAFSCGSPDQASAICSAYEFALENPGDRAYARCFFDPEHVSPYEWGNMVKKHPTSAAMWARSPALMLEPEEFWKFYRATAGDWEDEYSLKALRHFVIEKTRWGIPDIGTFEALGRAPLAAVMEGLVEHRNWSLMLDAIELAQNCFERERGASIGLDTVVAKIRVIGQACAKLAPLMNGHASVLTAIEELAQIDTKAAVELARSSLDMRVDLKDLDGSLTQPFEASEETPAPVEAVSEYGSVTHCKIRHPGVAVSWSNAKSHSERDKELRDLPSITLSVGEILGHWTGALARKVAKQSGAAATDASRFAFETLESISSFAPGRPERKALIERVELGTVVEPPLKPKELKPKVLRM